MKRIIVTRNKWLLGMALSCLCAVGEVAAQEKRVNTQNPLPVLGEERMDLMFRETADLDTAVCVEDFLPVYAPRPAQVKDVYQPVLSLNGTWLFHEQPDADFYQRDNRADWKPIVVPGEWAMQGFKVDSAGWAGYQTYFTLPADWKDKQIRLRFDGVSSEAIVYLNGKQVGTHAGGMTAFELDITKALLL